MIDFTCEFDISRKKTKLRMKYLTCFLVFLQFAVYAQEWQDVRFNALTLKDGLSQLTVTTILQDSRGMMWFGTRDGLNSYDGKTFAQYDLKELDKNIDNHVLALVEDQHGNLWTGTTNGLLRIEYATGKVESYFAASGTNSLSDNYIFSLACDASNRVVIGTKSGLNFYNAATNDFTQLFVDGLLLKNPIRSICISHDNSLYIGTDQRGLIQLNSQLRLVNHYTIDAPEKEKQINVVFEDKSGLIWFGGINKGLCVLNPGDKSLRRLLLNQQNEENISIRTIEEDGKGNLIIGTFNGLFLFNKAASSFTPFSDLYIPGGEINHYSILKVKYDNAGTLWVGTYSGGVNTYHPNNKRFTYYNPGQDNPYTGIIGMMVEDKNNNLWIASEGAGLIGWDRKKRIYSYHKIAAENKSSYSKNIIKSLYYENEKIYCGTIRSEIFEFDVRTRKFKLLHKLSDDRKVVYDILKDRSGAIWAGATGDVKGLYRISATGEKESAFKLSNDSSCTFNDVRSLLMLRDNVLLVGTRFDGLYYFDYANKTIHSINLHTKTETSEDESKYITSLVRDSRQRIWIGTYGKGVYCYTEKEGIIAHYDKSKGLADEEVASIVESADGTIWIGSKASISELNLTTGKITNYSYKNGIHLLELSHRAAYKSSDGRLFFSGSNGFISFHPQNISFNNFTPPVVFTGLYVNNQKVELNDASGILKSNLNVGQEIKLSYNQSNISISFAALNYIFPEHNTYAIKLEDVDKDWSYIGNRTEMNYANLAPGRYVFKVKASNNDGLWNEQPIELHFTISPPYWKTWWAYTFYVLLLTAVVVIVVYYLKIKHELEAKITIKQLEQEKSEEFHKERIQLFTNFSHEMRTPLTMILTPLADIIDKSELLGSIYKESLQLMQKNANRLLLLVNQLMDFQKSESGNLKLNVSQKDLVDFFTDIYLSFIELAKSQKIDFKLESKYDKIPAFFDENLLEKICFNLLSNAFKFCGEPGQVKLSLQLIMPSEYNLIPADVYGELKDAKGNLLKITVSDNGAGIAPENLKDIFTPFYQVSPSVRKIQAGSGIGLSLTRSIVKLCHGAMCVDSRLSEGTDFIVIIPIDKNNFTEAEMDERIPYYTQSEEHSEFHTEAVDLKNNSVLIIDDDDDIRNYISGSLSGTYKVLTASDGRQGLEIAIAEMPDLVLCDVTMPHINGIELCKRLKSNIKTGHIPIILITSRALSMQIQEGFNAGADEYITKPFRMANLLQKTSSLLKNRERLKNIYSKKFSLESLGIEVVSSDERFMTRINEIIQTNFANQDLDVDFIANELGMSRTNLYRKVKSLTNLSTIDLIINIRLLAAKRMLAESDLSIAEIAYETGFNTPAYFATSFKKQYGITPKEFVQQHRTSK